MNFAKKRKASITTLGIRPELVMIWCVFILSLFRIWLSYNTPLYVATNTTHDDANLMNKTLNLIYGNWVGEYNQYTLIKGITYSLFCVFCAVTRIPYSIVLPVFNIIAAYVFTRTIKKILPFKCMSYFLYLFLIYSPITFDFYVAQRLYRNALVVPFVLLIFAGIIGIYLNLEQWETAKRYAILTGISMFLFWNLREDCVWILPFIATASVVSFIFSVISYNKNRNKKTLAIQTSIIITPFLLLLAGNLILGCINYAYYGIFTTNDRTKGVFSDVVGLFIKIDYEDTDPELDEDVCYMSSDKFEYIIDHSESLSLHKETLLSAYQTWANINCSGDYVYGDHLQWAFRLGLTEAGFYTDAKETQNYLRQVRDELENEISNGNLEIKKGIFLSSSSKMLKITEIPVYFTQMLRGIFPAIISYSQVFVLLKQSFGDINEIMNWECVVNSFVIYPDETDTIRVSLSKLILTIEGCIIKLYQMSAVPMFVLAVIFYIIISIIQLFNIKWKNKQLFDQWVIASASILSVLVLLYIYTIFSCFSEDLRSTWLTFYNSAAFPLFQIFELLSIFCGAKAVFHFKNDTRERISV